MFIDDLQLEVVGFCTKAKGPSTIVLQEIPGKGGKGVGSEVKGCPN